MTEYPINIGLESNLPDRDLDIYNPKKDSVEQKNISDYQGKWLVLFFYPADFTFVCPTELKDLHKVYPEISTSNAELLVVSTDTVFSHKRRIETETLLLGFEINMISDRKANISKTLGIWNQHSGNSERATYIVSPDGVVKSIEIVTEPIGRSSVELVRKIKALEFVRTHPGHACPASRNPNDKTLQPSIKIAGSVGKEV